MQLQTFKNGPVLYSPPGTWSATLNHLYQLMNSTIWSPLLPGDQSTETTPADQRYQRTNSTSWWSSLGNLYTDNACWSTLPAGDHLYQLVTSTQTIPADQLYQMINCTSWWSSLPPGNLYTDNTCRSTLPADQLYQLVIISTSW